MYKKKNNNGFTLVEVLVVVAVFVMIVMAVSSTYVKIFSLLNLNKMKVLALDVANEQIEIIHNLPYSDVGEVSGIPRGKLASSKVVTRSGVNFTINTTIRNVDDVFDGTISSTTNKDLAPADYKFVQVDVTLGPTRPEFKTVSLVTYIAPKNLENSSTNGALFIKVFDANGNPVSGANVRVQNSSTTPAILLDDVTNSQGLLQIIDVPASTSYHVVVTKAGYSSDQTYPSGISPNPNPAKPDATVVTQQVTQVSFAIDQVSTMNISTVNSSCVAVPNVGFSVIGNKIISSNGYPSVLKYATSTFTTNGSGLYTLNNLEWDSYNINLSDAVYNLWGSNPLFPITVLPNSTQGVQLLVGPKNPLSILFGVQDSSGLPITDAQINMTKGSFSVAGSTGRGYVAQSDWSSGGGQTDFVDPAKYYLTDGNVDTSGTPGVIKLKSSFGTYASSGWLESSVFDLSGTTTLKQILWNPVDQPVNVGTSSVKFKIALSNENNATTTWNYVGPDGTTNTYFTVSNRDIYAPSSTGKFVRYKVFLSTPSSTYTPSVSDVMFTFTSSCIPPGQVVFAGLTSGTYNLTVSKSGYQNYSTSINVSSNFATQNITLTP